MSLADDALESLGNIWIALDRLDVAFADNKQLEENALRALFKVYLDVRNTMRIKLKVFLRNDIWARITKSGFREASHITRHTTIRWSAASLTNLIVRRALTNQSVIDFYRADADKILGSSTAQENFFYQIFPSQVERGKRRPTTLDWIRTRTCDGSRHAAPRELIHLLNCAVMMQLDEFDRGGYIPEGQYLIAGNAFKDALPEVSEVRLNQTLYAEYPSLRKYIERLKGEKTSHGYDTLQSLWKTKHAETVEACNELVFVGFFEERGTKADPEFWVPFLYRDALSMIQGSAD